MQLYANNGQSTLLAAITNVALSLQVAAGEGALFPNPSGGDFFLVTLCKVTSGVETAIEIVKVTARATDVFTIVRALEGTTALAYAAGDRVSLRLTAASQLAMLGGTPIPMGQSTSTVDKLGLTAPTFGIAPNVSAAGTNQGNATVLTADINIVTTVAANTGVVFPVSASGRPMEVRNDGANPLNVYPASTGAFNALAANAPVVLPIGASLRAEYTSTVNLKTMDGPNVVGAGPNIASAATINLDQVVGDFFHVTGTNAITAITLTRNQAVTLVFDGALVFTHNATTLPLPGGASITTAAGDRAEVRADGAGNVRCVHYTRASGLAVASAGVAFSQVATNAISGTPTSIAFTGLNCDDILIELQNVTVSAGSNIALMIEFSTNNGGAYGATFQFTGGLMSGTGVYSTVMLTGLRLGGVISIGASAGGTASGTSSGVFASGATATVNTLQAGAQITAIRLKTGSGTTFASGTINIKAR